MAAVGTSPGYGSQMVPGYVWRVFPLRRPRSGPRRQSGKRVLAS